MANQPQAPASRDESNRESKSPRTRLSARRHGGTAAKTLSADGGVAMLPEDELQRLFERLCVQLGFCLPPEGQQRLTEEPPSDVLSFTDAVFIEEGLDPQTADRHLYRQVRDVISDSFRRAGYDRD